MAENDSHRPSAVDDLQEGFETIRNVRGSFTWQMVHIVPFVAVVYGAVAWKPYYFFLGLAGVVLIVVLRRMGPTTAASQENKANAAAASADGDQKKYDRP